MIPVHELRIGNWVTVPEGREFCGGRKYAQVRSAIDIDIHKWHEPIHLTPEMFEKCGFVWENGYMVIDLIHARMKLGFYAGANDKMTLFQMQGLPSDKAVCVDIKFGANHPDSLHKLQNLIYALTGQELEISYEVLAQ